MQCPNTASFAYRLGVPRLPGHGHQIAGRVGWDCRQCREAPGGVFLEDKRMSATSYARLAAVVFAVIAVLQLVRALTGWPISVGGTLVPVWPSWIAAIVAAGLAWLGFTASRA